MSVKNITINNENDKNKLLKKLWFYRSIFFKNTTFKIINKTSNDQIKIIEKGLNIKSRSKRIEYLYDTAIDYIDEYNEKNKVSCEFKKDGVCGQFRERKVHNGCCRQCPFQSDKGCTSRNLACRLYFCSYVCKKRKPLKLKDLEFLKLFPRRERYIMDHNFFCTREEFLICLKLSSYIYITLFNFYKIFRIIIFNIKRKKNVK